ARSGRAGWSSPPRRWPCRSQCFPPFEVSEEVGGALSGALLGGAGAAVREGVAGLVEGEHARPAALDARGEHLVRVGGVLLEVREDEARGALREGLSDLAAVPHEVSPRLRVHEGGQVEREGVELLSRLRGLGL